MNIDEPTYRRLLGQLFEQVSQVENIGQNIRDRMRQLLLITTATTTTEKQLSLDENMARSFSSPLPSRVSIAQMLPPHIARLLRPTNWKPDRLGPAEEEMLIRHSRQMTEKYGVVDQRVDDLTDQADSEPDTRKAIRLLQKALKHSTSRASESRIYLSLAMKYEDLGDQMKAIEHYTKSIAVTEPFAIALYYRGLIYYEQQRLEEARKDISHALEFPKGLGLDTYNHEKARGVLETIEGELSAKTSGNNL